jgi:UDP-GlcNAc3NAcA epimerase
MKILTIVGARPQFIKAAAVSRALAAHARNKTPEILVHTGQHFDSRMSDVYFDELSIAATKCNLGISGGSHGAMTGRMLEAVEGVLIREASDWVIIYGDTNSTLARALAASKLHFVGFEPRQGRCHRRGASRRGCDVRHRLALRQAGG